MKAMQESYARSVPRRDHMMEEAEDRKASTEAVR